MQHIPHAGAVTSDSFLVFLLPTSYLIDFFFGLSKNAKHLHPLKREDLLLSSVFNHSKQNLF